MRFDISDDLEVIQPIYNYMNEHFGMQEEGKTWFWSTRWQLQGDCWSSKSGVEIWTDNPSAILYAMIKWTA